ncbi:DUF1853 family protein [Massilia sp. TS11]|uniref:DUF1853 family protein n=1 Tax=Massilia sp. TS11 TaxID=2908003 RepID=UPI001EDA59BC|nr:DUF1853 family protein [Massilia sp. TS11]MCG2584252.1 DUF1853 family protein [Massilia sp. TS11]
MAAPETSQQTYFARWGALQHPHVRALAWLLDAPDLLDPLYPAWQGRVAPLAPLDDGAAAWLQALDQNPAALDAFLGARQFTRIGLYAEQLLAFYLGQRGRLVAHGLQVRDARQITLGEFDFLLEDGAGLEHWELATKFYLLSETGPGAGLDGLLGPNLADTLGAKLRKIFSHQLHLGEQAAALGVLARPMTRARAVLKGWLFYPGAVVTPPGIAADHCRGFWCALAECAALPDTAYQILPRLSWLAPWQGSSAPLSRSALQAALAERFASHGMPALIAEVAEHGGQWREQRRGFIVPDDWRARAAGRAAPSVGGGG